MKSILNKLPKITIRRKIFLGFSLICMLLVILASIALVGILHIRQSVTAFTTLTEQANLLIGIDQATSHIHRNVIRFMHEGYDSARKAALERMTSIEEQIGEVIESVQDDPELERRLGVIQRRLEAYSKAFRGAIEEKQIHQNLLLDKMPSIHRDLENMISGLSLSEGDDHRKMGYLLYLSHARADYLSFFASLEAVKAREAQMWIRDLKLSFIRDLEILSDISPDQSKAILDSIQQYEYVANRAVQANRGYLYLINVVMSGEAAEVQYQTDKLRQSGQLMHARLYQDIERESLYVSRFIILMSSLICLIGLLLGFIIARQTTAPLIAITRTFTNLCKGRSIDNIPGIGRGDEIGELAEAANVFRGQNLHTQSMARELELKGRELELSNNELEQFVFTVSHDLKSPLITSMGFVGIIRELAAAGQFQDAIMKLDRIETANQRMAQLIDDLLDLSRLGRVEIECQTVDTGMLLQRLVDQLAPTLAQNRFDVELIGPFPPVYANESRVLQVFENILSNALKYGKSTEGKDNRIVVTCTKDQSEDQNVFQIRDFGQGIPRQFREKVFGLFTRLDSSQNGSGIGLAVVRKLMRLYNGDAWVAEADGEGALFCLAFPLSCHKAGPELS